MRPASEINGLTVDYLREYVDNKFTDIIERAAKNGERYVQMEISEQEYFEYTHRNTLLYKVKLIIEEYGYKVHTDRAGVGKNYRTGGYLRYKYFLRITW